MLRLLLLPALVITLQDSEWTSWEAVAQNDSGSTVLSHRYRRTGDPAASEVEWVLNLRNDTDQPISLSYRWALGGQSHTGSLKLDPHRIQEVTHSFPKSPEGTRPAFTVAEWHVGD